MQLKTITAAKDAPFPNIEFVKTDKQVTEVIIGGKLRIRKGESYSAALQILVEAPHEEVERFRLTATIEGFAPQIQYFETKYDAESAAAKFQDKGAETQVEKVTALADDSGEIVGIAGEATAIKVDADGCEVPF